MLIYTNFSINLIMENIIEPTIDFDFSQLNLENPSPLQGGNFFTKINYTDKQLPLYIQLPKCVSKHGIIKNTSSKKSYIDLMFNYYETDVLTWFENLELQCRQLIHNKKDIWFQTDITLDDIENMFISAIKSYKSGKFITIRAHIPHTKHIKKEFCMIYDEHERVLDTSDVIESTQLISLVCIEGIKFSSKSFQIEINLPQLMVISMQDEIKKDCMIKLSNFNKKSEKSDNLEKTKTLEITSNLNEQKNNTIENKIKTADLTSELTEGLNKELTSDLTEEKKNIIENKLKIVDLKSDTLEEINILVNNQNDNVSLKKPHDVYYEIYKAAKDKAKHMKQTALEAYLEAKNIKTKYMLDNIISSDDEFSNFSENEE